TTLRDRAGRGAGRGTAILSAARPITSPKMPADEPNCRSFGQERSGRGAVGPLEPGAPRTRAALDRVLRKVEPRQADAGKRLVERAIAGQARGLRAGNEAHDPVDDRLALGRDRNGAETADLGQPGDRLRDLGDQPAGRDRE